MPIALGTDLTAVQMRAAARKTNDGPQSRRLLALATIHDGDTHSVAARVGGVTLQIVRYWVVKFFADRPAGLFDRKVPGQPSKARCTVSGRPRHPDREWLHPHDPRRRAVARHRPVPMAVRGAQGKRR